MLVGLHIGDVRDALLNGGKLARQGWNGRGMFIFYVQPDEEHKIRGYVMMRTVDGEFVPWICSQSDFLASDWMVVDG